jgi:hypothetical protein
LASFEQFRYNVASRFEDQYDSLQEIAAILDAVHRSIGEIYRIVRKKVIV